MLQRSLVQKQNGGLVCHIFFCNFLTFIVKRMSCREAQEEELEVLRSIYESDERFKEIDPTTFQYKVGEDAHYKSFLLEVSWPEDYPDVSPNVNLDAFYNKHVSSGVKETIISKAKDQCELCLGLAATFSLFDWAKEQADELMADLTEVVSEAFCSYP